MAPKLEGTKTLNNLKKAFFAEAETHTKYQFYASKAKKEGLNAISAFFDETAKNEKEHAKLWFKAMHGDDVPLTRQNLLDCIKGENYEFTTMYEEYAQTAKEEGFDQLAQLFKMVGNIEKHHYELYNKFLNELDNDELFNNDEPILWICTNCGHVHYGKNPPESCPVCKHPQGYFIKETR